MRGKRSPLKKKNRVVPGKSALRGQIKPRPAPTAARPVTPAQIEDTLSQHANTPLYKFVNELGLSLKEKVMVEGHYRKGGNGYSEQYFSWVKTPGSMSEGAYSEESYQVNYYPKHQEITIYDSPLHMSLFLDEKGEKIIHERIRLSGVEDRPYDVTEMNGAWQYHYRDVLFKLGKAMKIDTEATLMPLGGFGSYDKESLEYKRAESVYNKMLPYQINKQIRRMEKWQKRQTQGPGFFEKLFSKN